MNDYLGATERLGRHFVDARSGSAGGQARLTSAMAEYRQIASRYWLMPHERWNAKRVIRHWYLSQRADQEWVMRRGPIEFTSIGVMQAWGMPGAILVVSGIGLLLATSGSYISYLTLYVGLGLILAALLRGLPLLAAVKRFQSTGNWRPTRLLIMPPGEGQTYAPPRVSGGPAPGDSRQLPPPPPPSPPPGPHKSHDYDGGEGSQA